MSQLQTIAQSVHVLMKLLEPEHQTLYLGMVYAMTKPTMRTATMMVEIVVLMLTKICVLNVHVINKRIVQLAILMIGLEMVIVMTKTTIQNATMMVETVVKLSSILNTVLNAFATTKRLVLLESI